MFSLEHILKYLNASAEQASDGSRRCMVGGEPRDVNNNLLLCCGLKHEGKIGSSPTGCSADAMIFFFVMCMHTSNIRDIKQTDSHMTPTSA